MQILTCPSAAKACEAAAQHIARAVAMRPRMVLGMATGGTMLPLYARLRGMPDLDLSQTTCFNLDEYVGLGPTHSASYHHYMQKHFYDWAGVPPERQHLPRGDAPDAAAEAARYEATIAQAGGIDLQLLGLGRNGHIGFNEPGAAPSSRTRVVALSASTRAANARFFGPGETPPHRAISMGVGTILEARACVLLATGTDKAQAVARMLRSPPGPDCPASYLAHHGDVTVILDHQAALLI